MERQPVRIEAVVYRANIDGVLSTVVVDDDDEGDEHMIVGLLLQMVTLLCTLFYKELPIIFLEANGDVV